MSTNAIDKCIDKTGKDPESVNAGEALMSFLIVFFNHQLTIKMAHFSTSSYAIHKATDDYLVKLEGNFDRFMEVLQGAIGKTNDTSLNIKDVSIIREADELREHLRQFRKNLYNLSCKVKHMPDLNAIRDEIMADAEQLIYLLTFK